MRSKLNPKAWNILKYDEQMAVSLKAGYGKSTWEAGEIIGRAHYKFLEVESRGRQFLKMFTEHFEIYEEVIPETVKLDWRVKAYFEAVIAERKTIKEAVGPIDDSIFKVKSYREGIIIKDLERLLKSNSAIDQNFALLVFDFDRWNNYRILPLSIQEPSAFKRRNKNNDKRNIKNLLSLTEFSIEKLKERFTYKSKDANKVLYMPIPSSFGNKMGYGIITVKASESIILEISKVGFFLFTRHELAQEFYDHILSFDFYNSKSCKEGQKFWPRYRQLIKQAINSNAIGKRIASRKFLESALRDLDQQLLNPKNKGGLKKKRRKKNKEVVIKSDS